MLPVVFLATGFLISANNAFKFTASAFPLPVHSKTLTVTAMERIFEFAYPQIAFCDGKYVLNKLDEVVDGIYKNTQIAPEDAYYTANASGENPFEYHAERNGEGIDKFWLTTAIDEALNSDIETVTAKTVVLYPSVTCDELKLRTQKLSEYVTAYGESSPSRKNNIALAARFIGCREISADGEFSFNAAVGERNEKRGFESSVVIENGKYTDGVGGGVCQVSSTVYACAAVAGMKLTERRGHTLLVSYTEPSFDAMVSDYGSDLKFKNNTQTTVVLVVDADGYRIRARIYGKNKDTEYKIVSQLETYVEPPDTRIIETTALPAGEYSAAVVPKRGANSRAYREIYQNGRYLGRELLSVDYYSPVTGVTLKGIGGKS